MNLKLEISTKSLSEASVPSKRIFLKPLHKLGIVISNLALHLLEAIIRNFSEIFLNYFREFEVIDERLENVSP